MIFNIKMLKAMLKFVSKDRASLANIAMNSEQEIIVTNMKVLLWTGNISGEYIPVTNTEEVIALASIRKDSTVEAGELITNVNVGRYQTIIASVIGNDKDYQPMTYYQAKYLKQIAEVALAIDSCAVVGISSFTPTKVIRFVAGTSYNYLSGVIGPYVPDSELQFKGVK